MITNFFAPKSKSGGGKRTRQREEVESVLSPPFDAALAIANKRRLVTPTTGSDVSTAASSSSSSSQKSLADETATLLSFLRQYGDNDEVVAGDSTWRNALERHFASAKFASLAKFIEKERASKTVYPPPELTFSALNLTPLHKVKVVIVGQDPYHQPGQAHGLSFSVPRGEKIPPSLRNIYKELCDDDGVGRFDSMPRHGNLERWARQGVLMLNNVLTVRRGEAASHAKKGWEEFTDSVIGAVVERDAGRDSNNSKVDEERGAGVVFLLWGKPASVKAQTVLAKYNNDKRAKHAVIMCSHPSPLGATKTNSPFMRSKCFSRANQELVKRGWKPIDWRVDGPLDDDE